MTPEDLAQRGLRVKGSAFYRLWMGSTSHLAIAARIAAQIEGVE